MSETLDPSLRDLNDCGCGAGTTAQTPVPLDNRDGLDHVAYRVGTHGQFKQSMLAALSEAKHAALRGLGTRADDDFTIALLDGWATVADVLTFYQERLVNESYLRTAIERRSVLELARTVGYELDPGVAAATWLAFMVEPSVEKVRIPQAVKVQSVPGQDEKPQTFETVGEIKEARPEWNVLKPKLTQPQTLFPFDMPALWIAGVNTNLRTGDSLLIIAESAGGDSEAALRRIVTVNADARAGRTELLLETGTIRITTAYSKSGVWALRVKTAPFGHNVPLKVDVTLNAPNAVVTDVAPTVSAPVLFTMSAKTVNAAGVASTRALTPVAPVIRVDGVVKSAAPPPPNVDTVTVPPAALTEEVDIVAHGPDAHLPLPLYSYTPQTNVVEVFNVPDVGIPKTITVTLKAASVDVTAHPATVDVTTHPSILTTTPGAAIVNRTEWPLEERDFKRLTLDAVYDHIQTDSWIVVDRPDPNTPTARQHIIADAKQILTLSRTDYGVAVRATQVLLDQDWLVGADTLSTVRQMVVYAQSEPLTLTEQPDETKIAGNSIVLDREIKNLFPGQLMIVSGMDFETGKPSNEVVTLDHTENAQQVTKLVFTTTLKSSYQRASVTIYANVGAATHGETVSEILGDGDAGAAYQRFALKQAPLTFTRADNDTGKESTLEIWVNDVRWSEVPSLFDRKPNERVYLTRLADDGTVTVLFGDGRSGARLPTGAGNIRAVYRKGTGLGGMVRAGQLKTLLTRPLGLRDVVSPLPATGADDPAAMADARRNAPLTVLTMGRVVSLQDYEDYARAYPGIAKALATWIWSGRLRGVMLTVAFATAPGGDPTSGGDVITKLLGALREFGNPFVPLQVRAFRPAEFEIAGTLEVEPDHDPDKVLAAARTALGDRYSFAAREFGQPVILSEVIAILQAVDGVVSLDIDHLQRTDQTDPVDPAPRLLAEFPAPGTEAGALPAELLTLNPESLNALRFAP